MSSGGSRTFRTIREEHSFAYCIESLKPDVRRIDDIIGNLKWKLSLDAESYAFPLPSGKGFVSFTEELRGASALRIFFRLEGADIVALAWIEEVDDAPPLGFDDWLD